MGTLGNKGNVSIRFTYFDTSFAAVNCHLASDLDKNEARINELLEVLKINFKDSNKKVKFKLNSGNKIKRTRHSIHIRRFKFQNRLRQ